MSAYRFIHVTDQHICDRAVGNRASTYPDEMKTKMQEVVDLCIAQRRHLFMSGDLFDSKRPNHVSHGLVKWLIDLFAQMHAADLRVYAIPGNHDLSEEGIGSLWKQPLGVIGSSGMIDLLGSGGVESFFLEDTGDLSIQVTAFPYHEDGEDVPDYFASRRDKRADYHILLTHGAVAPDSETLPYPHITYGQFPKEGADMVLCGHLHHDYGLENVAGTDFVQFGSLSRRNRTQKRDVRVALVDVGAEGASVVPYTLKTPLRWQDIFIESDNLPEYLIDPDMAELAKDVRSMMSLDELDFSAILDTMELPSGVVTRVRHYLEEAGIGNS